MPPRRTPRRWQCPNARPPDHVHRHRSNRRPRLTRVVTCRAIRRDTRWHTQVGPAVVSRVDNAGWPARRRSGHVRHRHTGSTSTAAATSTVRALRGTCPRIGSRRLEAAARVRPALLQPGAVVVLRGRGVDSLEARAVLGDEDRQQADGDRERRAPSLHGRSASVRLRTRPRPTRMQAVEVVPGKKPLALKASKARPERGTGQPQAAQGVEWMTGPGSHGVP